jgi:hypothetical protein
MNTTCSIYACQMHSVLSIYMSDLQNGNSELPRDFTNSVTRAVIMQQTKEWISWSDFSSGLPIAIRQRHELWEQYKARPDLHGNVIR